MLHVAHFRHEIGCFHQLRMGVASRADHVHALGPLFERVYHAFRIKHLVADHVVDFVKHHQIVLLAVNLLAAIFPGLLAHANVFWVGFRAADFHETAAHRPDFELVVAQHLGRVEFAIVPGAFDELDHKDPQSLTNSAKRRSERASGFSLARPGVDDQESLALRHSSPRHDNSQYWPRWAKTSRLAAEGYYRRHLESPMARREKAMKSAPMNLGTHQSDRSDGSNSRCPALAQPNMRGGKRMLHTLAQPKMPGGKRMLHRPTAKKLAQKSLKAIIFGRNSDPIAATTVRMRRKKSIARMHHASNSPQVTNKPLKIKSYHSSLTERRSRESEVFAELFG